MTGAIIIPLNYLSVSAISRGMSMSMALNLIPIMNAARYVQQARSLICLLTRYVASWDAPSPMSWPTNTAAST